MLSQSLGVSAGVLNHVTATIVADPQCDPVIDEIRALDEGGFWLNYSGCLGLS